jgi:hypothetical protein
MRRKQIEKNNTRKRSERQQRSFGFLLSLVSHVAAIVGTVAALVDLIHHW